MTPEHLKKAAGTLVVVMIALALHQKFVAPHLAPKKA